MTLDSVEMGNGTCIAVKLWFRGVETKKLSICYIVDFQVSGLARTSTQGSSMHLIPAGGINIKSPPKKITHKALKSNPGWTGCGSCASPDVSTPTRSISAPTPQCGGGPLG